VTSSWCIFIQPVTLFAAEYRYSTKWQAESLFRTFLIGCYAYCCIIVVNTNMAELPIKR